MESEIRIGTGIQFQTHEAATGNVQSTMVDQWVGKQTSAAVLEEWTWYHGILSLN